jgi:hypothetical protein
VCSLKAKAESNKRRCSQSKQVTYSLPIGSSYSPIFECLGFKLKIQIINQYVSTSTFASSLSSIIVFVFVIEKRDMEDKLRQAASLVLTIYVEILIQGL